MDALELYKFIKDNSIEWHWRHNSGTDSGDVVIFIRDTDELQTLADTGFCDDGGWNCVLTNGGYIALWMNEFCEYLGIEIEKVFPKEEEY